MTFDQFMRNVRGINDGESFSVEFLQDLYQSIVCEELKISSPGPGGEISRSLWSELIARSNSDWGRS